MLVKVEEIQDKGLSLRVPVERRVLEGALVDAEGFGLVEATPLEVDFTRISGRVSVRGRLRVTVSAPCRRCLLDTALEVPVEFSLRMVPQGEVREARHDSAPEGRRPLHRHAQADDDGAGDLAGSFELEQVDAEPFDGKTIDLDPILREQVLLALPVSVQCREDCRGLCPSCGQDLNQGACGHGEAKEVDPRLAKLGTIKLSSSSEAPASEPRVAATDAHDKGSGSRGEVLVDERGLSRGRRLRH